MKIIPSSSTNKKVVRYCSLASMGLKELSALENRRVYGGIAPSAPDTDTHTASNLGWNVFTILTNALIIFGFYKGCSLYFPAKRLIDQTLFNSGLPYASLNWHGRMQFILIMTKGEVESLKLGSSEALAHTQQGEELLNSLIKPQYLNAIKLKEQGRLCGVETCNLADDHMHFKWPAEPGDNKIISPILREGLVMLHGKLGTGAVLMCVSALAALTEVAYYGVPKAIARFTRKNKT